MTRKENCERIIKEFKDYLKIELNGEFEIVEDENLKYLTDTFYDKITIKCNKCNKVYTFTSIDSFKKLKYKCLYCAIEEKIKNNNFILETKGIPKIKKMDLSEYRKNLTNKKIKITCKICGTTSTTNLYNFLYASKCKTCESLKKLGIQTLTQFCNNFNKN